MNVQGMFLKQSVCDVVLANMKYSLHTVNMLDENFDFALMPAHALSHYNSASD